MNLAFWKNKTVFLTGHTGFKGAWLSFWLHKLGATVIGYALAPNSSQSLYKDLKLDISFRGTSPYITMKK